MIMTEFLPSLISYLRLCKRLKCTPIEYHNKTGRFVICRNVRQLNIFKLQCVLSLVYLAGMFFNLCFGSHTLPARLQGVSFFVIYLTTFIIRWNYDLDIEAIQVINSFLDFERTIIQNDIRLPLSSPETKSMKSFIRIAQSSVLVFPMLQLVLLTYSPCTPPFLLSMAPTCNEASSVLQYFLQFGTNIFETWMSFHNLFSCTIILFYTFCMGIVSILNYINVLKKYEQFLNHCVAHACM
ncbi:uncharacterized protein LOC118435721 [Folsomia candida]|uniref:uncharacterized protein LOC118435721 n=1 Tax=Folsomia candida TaxID=158441 RepID=UPI001604A366|nr:uncharacterized protein LOC118435721 [Folsomia candida]